MGQSPFWQQAGCSQHPPAVHTAAGTASSEAKAIIANSLRINIETLPWNLMPSESGLEAELWLALGFRVIWRVSAVGPAFRMLFAFDDAAGWGVMSDG